MHRALRRRPLLCNRLLQLAIPLALTAGCLDNATDNLQPSEAVQAELHQVELRRDAVRLGSASGVELVAATEQTLTLSIAPDAPTIAAGTVLVAANEIRRVVELERLSDTTFVATTELAGLGDAFDQLDFSVHFAPSSIDSARADSQRFAFALGSMRLFASGNVNTGISAATYSVTPDVSATMNLAERRFHADYDIKLAASFNLHLEAHGAGRVGHEAPLPGMKRDFVILAGWVPIVITVELVAGWSVAYDGDIDITVPIELNERLSGAVDHAPGDGWVAPLRVHTPIATAHAPRVSATSDFLLEGKIFIKPKVTVAPFKVAGVYIDVEPNVFLRIYETTNRESGLRLGINVNSEVGAALNLFEALGSRVGLRYRLFTLFDVDIWTRDHQTTPASPSSSCERYAVEGPKVGSTKCNVAGLQLHYQSIFDCVRGSGGKSCFTDPQRYGEPLCGSYDSFVKTCNLDQAFTCVCHAGGKACFREAQDICR